MKILVMNWRDIRSPEAGGSEIHLHEIAKRLVEFGHEITLVCSQFASAPGPAEEVVDGIRTIRVGAWWNAHWTVPATAKRLMRDHAFDLLIDDVNKIPFCAPRFSKIPTVAIFHHLLGNSVFLETNPLFATAIRLYESQVGCVYARTPAIAVSRSTAEELVAHGIPRDNLHIAPPGLDHHIHRPGLAEKAKRPLLLVVSRLKRYKRVDVAIRALAHMRKTIPDAQLVVIGEGNERARLERLAKAMAQPVTFLGYVSQEEKARWMNRAHVLLNPSTKEGWGMTAIEAMACGTAVVASDVPGHRDSVPTGTGIRTRAGEPSAMARGAIEVLSGKVSRRADSSAWAARFTWDALAERLEHFLCETAGRLSQLEIPLSLNERVES